MSTDPGSNDSARGADNHPLFQAFPIAGQTQLSTGKAPFPYQVYDGTCLLLGGEADLQAARSLLTGQDLQPLRTTGGQALAGLWICDFSDASLGPHSELQLSLFVSRGDHREVDSGPFEILRLLAQDPEAGMFARRIWNNSPQVVAYNNERLGLEADLAESSLRLEERSNTWMISFKEAQSGETILEAQIQNTRGSSLSAMWGLMRSFGFRNLLAFNAQPWISIPVINPIGEVIPRNDQADTHAKSAQINLRRYEHQQDSLQFGPEAYRALRFRPAFVEQMDGFRFVYLDPRPVPVSAPKSPRAAGFEL